MIPREMKIGRHGEDALFGRRFFGRFTALQFRKPLPGISGANIRIRQIAFHPLRQPIDNAGELVKTAEFGEGKVNVRNKQKRIFKKTPVHKKRGVGTPDLFGDDHRHRR